jgi:hypothetical protein
LNTTQTLEDNHYNIVNQQTTNTAATNHTTHSGVQDSASEAWASLNTTTTKRKYTTATNHKKQPQLQHRKAQVHGELGESRGTGVNGPGSSWGLEALVPVTQRSKEDVILNLLLKNVLKDTKEGPGRDVVEGSFSTSLRLRFDAVGERQSNGNSQSYKWFSKLRLSTKVIDYL